MFSGVNFEIRQVVCKVIDRQRKPGGGGMFFLQMTINFTSQIEGQPKNIYGKYLQLRQEVPKKKPEFYMESLKIYKSKKGLSKDSPLNFD